jgi:hypothetical protein
MAWRGSIVDTHDVEVEVVDALGAVLSVIDDYAESRLVQLFLRRNLACRVQQIS